MPSIKRIFYASSLEPIFECNNTIMGHLSHIVSYENNNNNNDDDEQLTFHFLWQSTESFDNHLHVPRTSVRFVTISFVIGTSLDGALLSSALLQLQTEIIFLLLYIKKEMLMFIFISFSTWSWQYNDHNTIQKHLSPLLLYKKKAIKGESTTIHIPHRNGWNSGMHRCPTRVMSSIGDDTLKTNSQMRRIKWKTWDNTANMQLWCTHLRWKNMLLL